MGFMNDFEPSPAGFFCFLGKLIEILGKDPDKISRKI